jgi:Glycosyl transferase family 2
MRVIALLAAHNEERFIGHCIEHLARHGIDSYLIDNESEDATVELANRHRGRGLVGLETAPSSGVYAWRPLLERKEELAATLQADWFLHVDPDEIRLPPHSDVTLVEAIAEVERLGYNAINFQEYTFVPTVEAPDHDHACFLETMRHYYAFLPSFPDRLNAWKRQEGRVDLATSGGHRVDFPGMRLFPRSFPMRHYLYLSVDHAARKYLSRAYATEELERGWHRRRAALRPEAIALLSQSDLRESRSDDDLDPSSPLAVHPLFAASA